MSIKTIDGITLRKMFISGSNELINNRDLINSLNVFPVPDGDTGNNMSLTVESAVKEILNEDNQNIYDIAKLTSRGALKGARGNSGVILSQLFRGFTSAFKGKSRANSKDFANAVMNSSKAAYKAVMKPKEGTILTVAREMGEEAERAAKISDDIVFVLEKVIAEGNRSLERTTELLPQLKEANVVDSGGKGLLCLYIGMLKGLLADGDIIIADVIIDESEPEENIFHNINVDDIEFAYCTEFFINTNKKNINMNSLKNFYQSIGDSLVLVDDEDIVKIHVHTNEPNKALEKGLSLGSLSKIKIENMKEQHTELIKIEKKKDPIGFISVCSGKGIVNTFKEYGSSVVIEGGQTMNPSTDDILKAIDKVNSDNVIILPNNKNIILAANQAKDLSNKNVEVINSLNVPQGLNALIAYVPSDEFHVVVKKMQENISLVHSGSITFAVRDTVINNTEIKKDDFISVFDGDIVSSDDDLDLAVEALLNDLVNDETDFLNIFYNDDVNENNLKVLENILKEKYEDIEYEIIEGNQPLYYYVISAE